MNARMLKICKSFLNVSRENMTGTTHRLLVRQSSQPTISFSVGDKESKGPDSLRTTVRERNIPCFAATEFSKLTSPDLYGVAQVNSDRRLTKPSVDSA